MSKHGGDDLDDDFVPDELVALSDEEETYHSPEDEDITALLSADETEPTKAEPTPNEAAAAKKRKRREKEKERKAKVCRCYDVVP